MKKRTAPDRLSPDPKPSRMGATEEDGVMQWVERKPLRSSATGPPDSRFEMKMKMPDTARKSKAHGRLNRAVLAMLGKGLEDCFDEVRKQEVPERFKLLLQRF
ncbi:MAG TPA: hypothetical protein VG291_02165 [Xanthobacteraceae bacterium]|jgi:hypothetical protein|nr:hypothetical protein [Xanthobacteraceae bacterium]